VGALERLIRESGEASGRSGRLEPRGGGSIPPREQERQKAGPDSGERPGLDIATADEPEGWPAGADPDPDPAFGYAGLPEEEAGYAVRRSSGPSWFKVLLSVAAALATGAVFGYLVLSLFTDAALWPGGGAKEPAGSSSESAGGLIAGTPPEGLREPEAGNEDPTSPSPGANGPTEPTVRTVDTGGVRQTYYMLQFGVFSKPDSRDAALKQLADLGLPGAAQKTGDGYRVYAGIAAGEAQAKLLASKLPELQLYRKELVVQPPEKLPFDGSEEAAAEFLQRTEGILATATELVMAQLEQAQLTSLSKAAAAAWEEKLQAWTASADAMKAGLSAETGAASFEKLAQAVNAAAKSVALYNGEPSAAHLWSAQQSLMEAVLAQKEWFDAQGAL
jgi:Sporulation related domain.